MPGVQDASSRLTNDVRVCNDVAQFKASPINYHQDWS